jgi:hypothetical protein
VDSLIGLSAKICTFPLAGSSASHYPTLLSRRFLLTVPYVRKSEDDLDAPYNLEPCELSSKGGGQGENDKWERRSSEGDDFHATLEHGSVGRIGVCCGIQQCRKAKRNL